MSETLSQEAVRQELRAVLKSHGLRATALRLASLQVLHEHAGPMTQEQVLAALPEGVFDPASLWRSLAELSDKGMLRRMDLGDRVWRYELVDACRSISPDHAHFLCDDCGVVRCLPPVRLVARQGGLPELLQGAQLKLRVSGRCALCAAA
ncbi:MAG: Fur family ferric uptake transcriptional regulator [Cognaticolwellia sp.]